MRQFSPSVLLLRELIAIPSVNPAFLPPGDSRTGEAAMAGKISDLARRAGLDVEQEKVVDGRSNVIACLAPTGVRRQRVVLGPHLDTVGWPALDELLRPRVANGRVIGRGACDTKGCVVAMLTALTSVARQGK